MVDFRDSSRNVSGFRSAPYKARRRGSAGTVLIVAFIAILLVAVVMFATGFWTASMTGGHLPQVSVQGGSLPTVDVSSKQIVVGTTQRSVNLPKLGTQKTTIDVPAVGVKDNK